MTCSVSERSLLAVPYRRSNEAIGVVWIGTWWNMNVTAPGCGGAAIVGSWAFSIRFAVKYRRRIGGQVVDTTSNILKQLKR